MRFVYDPSEAQVIILLRKQENLIWFFPSTFYEHPNIYAYQHIHPERQTMTRINILLTNL